MTFRDCFLYYSTPNENAKIRKILELQLFENSLKSSLRFLLLKAPHSEWKAAQAGGEEAEKRKLSVFRWRVSNASKTSSHGFIYVKRCLYCRQVFHFGREIRFWTRKSVDLGTEERRMSTKPRCFRVFLVFFILSMFVTSHGHSVWKKPGCHKVGHTRKVSIPDCVEFHITTNACRGFCESWSIPSGKETLRVNPFQLITSVGQCCNIMETEDVEVKVMCLDGTRDLIFKSAKSCSCYHCKKD